MTKFGESIAARVDVNASEFVKKDALLEVPFIITKAWLATSNFDPHKEAVHLLVTFYDDEERQEFEFSTEEGKIKEQVKEMIAEDAFPYEECTLSEFGKANGHGNYRVAIFDGGYLLAKPEEREPAPRVQRDTREDKQRQLLTKQANIPAKRGELSKSASPSNRPLIKR